MKTIRQFLHGALDVREVRDGDVVPGLLEPPCPRCQGAQKIQVAVGQLITFKDGTPFQPYRDEPCPVCQKPACDVCGDLGWVMPDNLPPSDPRFVPYPCPAGCDASRTRQRAPDALTRYARLDPEYAGCTFASFEALPADRREGKMAAYYAAMLFVAAAENGYKVNRADVMRKLNKRAEADVRNWLVFHGEPGRGKTGLAAAILHALVDAGKPVLYARLQDWLKAVQDRYGKPGADGYDDPFGDKTSSEVVDLVRDAPVLILDEFDTPNNTPDKLDKVWLVVNYRYNHKLPTVITTNLDPAGVERRWDGMIASRIGQRAHWLPLTGPSLRATPNLFGWE